LRVWELMGLLSGVSYPANLAHIRQSRPDSGLGFQVKVLQTFQVVPSSLGRVHGYLADKKQPPPQDPTVGPFLGSYGNPRGEGNDPPGPCSRTMPRTLW
jgi:hypothetical protein